MDLENVRIDLGFGVDGFHILEDGGVWLLVVFGFAFVHGLVDVEFDEGSFDEEFFVEAGSIDCCWFEIALEFGVSFVE